jgi:competence protein ComEC
MTLVYVGLAWMGGIWLASVWDPVPAGLWGGSAILAGLAAFWLRRRPHVPILFLCLAAICAGGLRYQLAQPTIDDTHVTYFNEGDPVTFSGRVVREPETQENALKLVVAAEMIAPLDGEPRPVSGLVLLNTQRYRAIEYGALVTATGRLETPQNFGDFDYRAYLARRDIYSVMAWPEISATPDERTFALFRTIFGLKAEAKATISRLIPEPEAALLTGILLGDDNGISPDLDADFKTTGMTHIIAISGFNVMLIAGVLVWLGEWPFGRRGAVWFALAGIFIYTILVGAEPSVVRAAIMGSLFIFATRYLGRPVFAIGTLFLAAIAMTLVRPDLLWEVGFQLSFMAVLGLMLYSSRFADWTRNQFSTRFSRETTNRLIKLTSDIILATLAAQILVLPMIVAHFERVSLASILANALVLPAQPGVMIWGGLTTLVGLVAEPLAVPLGWVAYLFLHYTVEVVRLLAQMPFASLPLTVTSAGIVASYALVFGVTWLARQKRETRQRLTGRVLTPPVVLVAGGIAVFLVWQWSVTQPDGRLHVAFLDVGQGEAIFIQSPAGRQLLVDGGPHPTVLNERLGEQMPFWDRSLDMVVATHPDADHISGLPGVFARYDVDVLVTNGFDPGESGLYAALLQAAEENGTTITPGRAGTTIDLGDGVTLQVLHPGDRWYGDDRNENSVSLRLAYGDFTLLLTGDAGVEAERDMVAGQLPLDALVFKAGHHGSRTSSHAFFLDQVHPQIMVVSAGVDNRYGHPHPEVLERATAAGAAVLRTDELGTIEVMTDGRQMWWSVSR